ncbi:hypothetical protein ACHAWF_018142 [Thalassiosira exigua]
MARGTAVMFMKTFAQPKPKVEFDIESVSVDDLKSLRKNATLNKPIDMSNLGSSKLYRNATCPVRLQSETNQTSQSTQKVLRKSRISFDCHPDMLLEDTIERSSESSGSDEEDPYEVMMKPFQIRYKSIIRSSEINLSDE